MGFLLGDEFQLRERGASTRAKYFLKDMIFPKQLDAVLLSRDDMELTEIPRTVP